MNTADYGAIAGGVAFRDELLSSVDERTLEIIDRRRSTAAAKRRGWLVRRALLAADVVGLSIAFLVPWLVFGGSGAAGNRLGQAGEYGLVLFAVAAWVVAAKLYGLYDKDEERTDHSTADEFAGVFHLVTVMSWLLFAACYLTPVGKPYFGRVLLFWVVAGSAVPLVRAVARAHCRRQLSYLQNTLIVGAGEVGQLIARKVLLHPEYGINLVGFVDAEPKERQDGLEHLALLPQAEGLPSIVRLLDVERVIIAFSNESHDAMLDAIRDLKDLDVQIDIVPRLFEVLAPGVGMHMIEGLPLIGLPPLRLSRSSLLLKRGLDLGLTVPALVLLAPVFALVALLVKLDSPGPVFFRQTRVGADDRPFEILKFRSMARDADERKGEVAHLNKHLRNGGDPRMFKIDLDPRITGIGRTLRRFSIDELPQLWNVLRGQMSLVGPRPLIPSEHEQVADWAGRRLDLRPGITGLWQVAGRDGIPFGEMVKLDYLYVTSWTLAGDMRLLLRTLPLVLRGRGR